MNSLNPPLTALSRCAAYPAEAFTVETGALMGDPIGGVEEVVAGDIFVLTRAAAPRELLLTRAHGGMAVAEGSGIGQPGQPIRPLARHQLMSERGAVVEILVVDLPAERLALPLGPLTPGEDYTLISSSPAAGELAGVAQVSFARGTRITMADGYQHPVETLSAGDRVLTRDHGPQPIRWTGRQTVRAEGADAPVVIARGALNNAEDLVLSPDHRLFIYQRRNSRADTRIGGRAELLVRARHLVDGENVWRGEGGHIDYFHLLFDAHEIIYVECIPAESLLVSPDVMAGLGEDLARDLVSYMAGRRQVPHQGVEPTVSDLDRIAPGGLLRRLAR
ncbi:Hint domain-containing protein [Jannaschia seosinensis]|nr:Hint domain-containing protein [Jannaschia seosinensis]